MNDPFLPLARSGIRPGLARIRRLLHDLGSPERRVRTVLVAGSNGKGSTAAMLEAMLRAAGYRTGLFTSPHLVSVTERFRIDGACVAPEDLRRFMRSHARAIQARGATYFEATTACALWLFARQRVDWAVLEIGLGGRWDACNAAAPEVSVVTSISREHTEYLGTTLAAIAREKAQVARRGHAVIVGRVAPAARRVLREEFRRLRAVPFWLGEHFDMVKPRYHQSGSMGRLVARGGGSMHLRCALRGRYALDNAALAACAFAAIAGRTSKALSPKAVRHAIVSGAGTVHWPARLEVVGRRPLVVLDVAHNAASFEALADDWKRHWPGIRPTVVVGLLADKSPGPIGNALARITRSVILTTPESPRATSPERLARSWRTRFDTQQVIPDLRAAIREAVQNMGPGDSLLITGSHFVVGPACGELARLGVYR